MIKNLGVDKFENGNENFIREFISRVELVEEWFVILKKVEV